MNPLDWTGPLFLAFFFLCLLGAGAFTFFARSVMRALGTVFGGTRQRDLHPLEYAALAGGPMRAVDAAALSLVQSEALACENRRLVRTGPKPEGLHPLESALYHSVGEDGATLQELRSRVARPAERIRARLVELKLLAEDGWRRWAPTAVAGSLALLGLAKILVGISRGRSVGLLVFLELFVAVLLFIASSPLGPTRAGRKTLEEEAKRCEALKLTARSNPASLSGSDASLALGLFGASVFAGALLAPSMLHAASMASVLPGPKAVTGGGADSGGCGSCSSCSSCSSCGGGCGGCS